MTLCFPWFLKLPPQNLNLSVKNGKSDTVTTTESCSGEEWLQEIRKCQPHVIRSSFKINWSVMVWGVWRRGNLPQCFISQCLMTCPCSVKGSWPQRLCLIDLHLLLKSILPHQKRLEFILCVSVVCLQRPRGVGCPGPGCQSLLTELLLSESSYGCWERNLSLLQEQLVL